ncbi:MAG: class I SAM-dependent methyltransferase [Planctomycetota bacterium]
MKQMTKEQQIQEEQYIFPYHYLSLYFEKHKRLLHLHYLSMLRTVCETLRPFNGERLLDVGCGDGRLCYELKKENVNYTGVDYSANAIAFAKAFNPDSNFHVLNATERLLEEKFDIITLLEVIEHIPPGDISDCIKMLNQALKTGGRLIISAPSVNLPVISKHYQHFTEESLVKLMPSNFEIIKKIGHTKSGKYWERYTRLVKYSDFLWPLQSKIPFVNNFLKYVESYYKNIELCEPGQANTIILVFKKN